MKKWMIPAGVVLVALMILIGAMWLWQGSESTVIRTTGATFPQYQMQKWIEIYQKENTDVKIEYEGGGSGHGQEAFLNGLTHIGRTDPPVTESVWNRFLDTGDQPLQFPEVVGAVVVAYNVKGVSHLNLSRELLVKIFMGDVRYWDNESLREINPGVDLPHEEIKVVHRSDSSGTTAIFTTYLSIISERWANEVGAGKSVDWPVDRTGRGLAGNGNPGVVAVLKQTEGSICYTEYSFAIEEGLKTAKLENRDGIYVECNTETVKASVEAVSVYIPPPTEGYRENLTQLLDPEGNDTYPIVAFTHILVWENKGGRHYTSEEARAIKDFLRWILTEGQKEENLAPGYVGLPESVVQIGLQAVEMIKT